MNRQNMTIHDSLKGITPTMEIAIDLLAAGATATAAAAAVEVTRQTVSGWKNRHPGFQAALNLRRFELIAGARRQDSRTRRPHSGSHRRQGRRW